MWGENCQITTLLIANCPLIQQSVKQQLDSQDDISLVTIATKITEVGTLIKQHRPGVVLLDYDFTLIMNGGDRENQKDHEQIGSVILDICSNHPETRLIILSAGIDDELSTHITRLGIDGHIIKNDEAILYLPDVIRIVSCGGSYYSKGGVNRNNPIPAQTPKQRLTVKQIEVLAKIISHPCLSYPEYAESLKISKHTFDTHLRNIFQRMETRDLASTIIIALRSGLIPLHPDLPPVNRENKL